MLCVDRADVMIRRTNRPGTIERAFELARSGEFASLKDIERQLLAEQYDSVADHLGGPFTRSQLRSELARVGSGAASLASC